MRFPVRDPAPPPRCAPRVELASLPSQIRASRLRAHPQQVISHDHLFNSVLRHRLPRDRIDAAMRLDHSLHLDTTISLAMPIFGSFFFPDSCNPLHRNYIVVFPITNFSLLSPLPTFNDALQSRCLQHTSTVTDDARDGMPSSRILNQVHHKNTRLRIRHSAPPAPAPLISL
jgi:hypothetical protein